jgi:hypothetical protein
MVGDVGRRPTSCNESGPRSQAAFDRRAVCDRRPPSLRAARRAAPTILLNPTRVASVSPVIFVLKPS